MTVQRQIISVVFVRFQVMANVVMEQLLPSLEKDMLPRLKAKKTEKKRVWFAVSHTVNFYIHYNWWCCCFPVSANKKWLFSFAKWHMKCLLKMLMYVSAFYNTFAVLIILAQLQMKWYIIHSCCRPFPAINKGSVNLQVELLHLVKQWEIMRADDLENLNFEMTWLINSLNVARRWRQRTCWSRSIWWRDFQHLRRNVDRRSGSRRCSSTPTWTRSWTPDRSWRKESKVTDTDWLILSAVKHRMSCIPLW